MGGGGPRIFLTNLVSYTRVLEIQAKMPNFDGVQWQSLKNASTFTSSTGASAVKGRGSTHLWVQALRLQSAMFSSQSWARH